MTLPSFLVIGAMKAGTTTLFRDLRSSPGVFMPGDKELHDLNTDEVLTDAGRQRYEAFFSGAAAGQVCGEASTGYSKLPDITGVPERAKALLPSDLRVVYIVRDPIARLISQYHHHLSNRVVDLPIDTAIRDYAPLINYSRYAMQIEPWIATIGREQVRILIFEDYVRNRSATVASLLDFLGVEEGHRVEEGEVYNKGAGRPVHSGPFAVASRSGVYQRVVRPLIPLGVRDSLRRLLLPKAPPKAMPMEDTIRWAESQLREDMERFRLILGVPALPWNLSAPQST